jgi:hypothetical protein
MLFRVRRALAGLLMAGSTAWVASGLLGWWDLDRELRGMWVVLAALAVGTFGLAQGAWWGRLIPLAWSLAVTLVSGVGLLAGAHVLPVLGGGLLLGTCLVGKEMFTRYEGNAPSPLDWTQPGMRFVRVAVVANLYAFLAAVALIPLYEGMHSCLRSGFQPPALMWVALGMTAVMLVGVLLLLRQRTAGMLLVAVAAVALPLVLMAGMRGSREAPLMVLAFGPGVLCGWLALARFAPGMVRLLRR